MGDAVKKTFLERFVEVFCLGGAGGGGHVDVDELRDDGMEGRGGGADLPISKT